MTLSTESINKIGIVGLVGVGTMGKCMLNCLQEAGFTVSVYDPFPPAREYAKEQGALIVESPGELAKNSRLIIMSLPAPKQVFEVLHDMQKGLTSDHVVVDTSTVSPDTSKTGSKIVGVKGAKYVDSPILGRPSGAGSWLLPSGGNEEAIEFARPALETFAKKTIRVGDSGSGNAFKLLNQLMFSVINGISAEVMALADVLGVDKKMFYEVISNSGAATVSGLFKESAKRIVEDKYDKPTFTMELLCKDAGLGLQMTRDAGVTPLIASFVQSINENAKGKGLSKQDTSSLAKVFKEYFSKLK